MKESLPRHIPDERVAAWKEMSLDELMAKSMRLQEHLANIVLEEQRQPMIELANDLEQYIESIIESKDIDLGTFLQ